MQLVLDSKGLKLIKKENTFLVESEKSSRVISPAKINSIAITTNVLIDSSAIKLAIEHQIPILFFDRIGRAKARLWSPYFTGIATLRRGQIQFAEQEEAASWIVDLFLLKTEQQLAALQYLKEKSSRLGAGLGAAVKQIKRHSRGFEAFRNQLLEECRGQIMGVEGNIARVYWMAVGAALPRAYAFQKRSRRPAEDIFNAALNYLYGMLYTVVEAGIFAAGLDPYLGFLHADEYRKPTLAFDLIEPFRPWIDRLLVQSCLRGEVKKEFFTKNQFGLFLNKAGKAYFIPLFNDFLRSERTYFNQESNVRNHIYFLAAKLAQRIRSFSE